MEILMQNVNFTGISILLTSLLFLLGCSATQVMQPPLFDVQPVEEQTGYFSEENEIGCTNTYIEYVEQEGDLFLFYVEVKNSSGDTQAVYPQEIYLETVKGYENQDNQNVNRYFAIEPSHEIELIDKKLKEESDRHDNATALNIFFGVFGTVIDLASDIDNKGEAVANDILNTGANQFDEEIYHSDSKKSLEENKNFWMNEMLNESYVNPGDTVSGLVYLPYDSHAEMFKVVIPVCGFPDSYLFRQVQINK
jgi:hypothetical protein